VGAQNHGFVERQTAGSPKVFFVRIRLFLFKELIVMQGSLKKFQLHSRETRFLFMYTQRLFHEGALILNGCFDYLFI
jgi:hypothetical protein